MLIATIACFISFILAAWMFIKSRNRCRLPPEPKGSYIFGNALQLDMKQFSLQMAEMGKNFDDAYTVRILNDKFVILNSYDIIKEAMISPKYAQIMSGRPPSCLGEHMAPKDEMVQTYSEEWAVLRKTVFRGLKTYGTHMRDVENLVQEELKHLVSRIGNEAGKSVDPYDDISQFVISIILMLVTGQHPKHDDLRLQLCNEISDGADSLSHPIVVTVLTTFPWIRHIPLGIGKEYMRLKNSIDTLKSEVYRRREGNEDRKPCFLDFMLEEEKKGHVSEESVSSVAFVNLLSAGTCSFLSHGHVTLPTVFRYRDLPDDLCIMLMVLASKPDVQLKIQEEIDREIGRSRLPCAEDKHRMPYAQAVLWEVLRLYCPLPIPMPHYTLEDVEIRDYFLPKNTVVFYNMWNVVHDETFWKDPWEFDPSRFLDDAGELVPPEDEKRHRMIAFGVGKRLCVGEALARLRIFMGFVAILQNFTVLPDPQNPLPDADPRTFDVCILLSVPRYKVIFHERGSS